MRTSVEVTQQLVQRLRAAGCVFAEDEAALLLAEAADPTALEAMTARRVAGEPLEYVVGWAAFGGLRIALDPGIFVPRRRTELLAAEAFRLVSGVTAPVVLDLCCGSGALGAVIMDRLPDAEVWAADLDPAAVACARRNLPPELVVMGDLFAPVPFDLRGRLRLLLVNAPYVPTDEIVFLPVEAREHEHRVALDGGDDGLAVHRRVLAEASDWLAPGGSLLIEVSDQQQPTATALVEAAGLVPRTVRDEETGAVVIIGLRPADLP